MDVGCWIHSEFKIAHSKFGFLVPTRTAAFRSGMKFRIQHCSFKIRVSDADEDGGVPVGVKKVMPWIFPSQAGGLRLEG